MLVLYLGAPQFDGPVKGGGDKQVGEVQGSWRRVTAEPRDWSVVALEHLADARFAADRTEAFKSRREKLAARH